MSTALARVNQPTVPVVCNRSHTELPAQFFHENKQDIQTDVVHTYLKVNVIEDQGGNFHENVAAYSSGYQLLGDQRFWVVTFRN